MPLIRHIFTATDLSDNALPAVDRGFELAAATGARLTLMHAAGVDALAMLRGLLGGQTDDISRQVLTQRREALEAAARDRAQHQDVDVTLLVEPGRPASVVPARVAESGADLAVVGTRGEGSLRRLIVGSTASRLLRQSRCPVLLVKNPDYRPYRRVLVPVDFSPGSALAIRLARELAPGADLVLLHVFTTPFEGVLRNAGISPETVDQYRSEARERAQQQLRALAVQTGLEPDRHTPLALAGDTVGVIIGEQERLGCDLIAMGKHGTNVTTELLLGSVTQRVLSESDADVLVVVNKQPAP